MSIIDLLQRFARYQGNASFRPVHTKYRHMESILNVRSLGNLNRQFVSLLRSEQDDLKVNHRSCIDTCDTCIHTTLIYTQRKKETAGLSHLRGSR